MKHIKNLIHACKNNVRFYQTVIKDSRTPKISKILLSTAVAYALSPIDLIPDCIPVIGILDDVIIVAGLITVALWMIPKIVLDDIKNETFLKIVTKNSKKE